MRRVAILLALVLGCGVKAPPLPPLPPPPPPATSAAGDKPPPYGYRSPDAGTP